MTETVLFNFFFSAQTCRPRTQESIDVTKQICSWTSGGRTRNGLTVTVLEKKVLYRFEIPAAE